MPLKLSCSLFALILFLLSLHPSVVAAQAAAGPLGIFEGHTDIGSVTPPGTLKYSPAKNTYTIDAAGWDLWSAHDGFHYAWKKLSGDLSLTASIDFPIKTGVHHPSRKAALMIRQTLDDDSAYVDVAQHGTGFTALQYRATKDGQTQGMELNIDTPSRVRLEKRGDTFTMFVSLHGEPLHQFGANIRLHFDGPFYVGIGVSAHNTKVAEKAVFSNVELKQLTPPATPAKLVLYSTIQATTVAANSQRALLVTSVPAHIQAPNWSRDGKFLVYDQDGRMFQIPVGGGTPQPIDIGSAVNCSGSHGFSPDGKWLAISCAMPGHPERHVSIIPASGGTPRLLTEKTGYFHSWSPDGKTILFTRSEGHGSFNIYSNSVDGGPETPLTAGTGVSDDPDYSPDGKYIYFQTDRWGGMQIGRMKPDGSQPEQVTSDNFKNRTPHPSPDGKSIVFVSYDPSITKYGNSLDVALHILSTEDNKTRTLLTLVGGEGTMNTPNWSPDSKSLAFVSYQMLPAEDNGSTE